METRRKLFSAVIRKRSGKITRLEYIGNTYSEAYSYFIKCGKIEGNIVVKHLTRGKNGAKSECSERAPEECECKQTANLNSSHCKSSCGRCNCEENRTSDLDFPFFVDACAARQR